MRLLFYFQMKTYPLLVICLTSSFVRRKISVGNLSPVATFSMGELVNFKIKIANFLFFHSYKIQKSETNLTVNL